jgi:hypothetical protein
VSHLAGIRHYEKAGSNKNNNKEIVSKQTNDKKSVMNFFILAVVFQFHDITIYVWCLLLVPFILFT